jgi:hypothetical protein
MTKQSYILLQKWILLLIEGYIVIKTNKYSIDKLSVKIGLLR